MENICCGEGKCITINTVNTLNVNCCCNGGGDKPEPPTPEEPEKKYKTMTVKVDLSNSDPATCCSYSDDAVGMTAGDAAWDEFFGHYPVMFQDGKEIGKLNPNDFTKSVDGTDADITSGADGDVMIAFPRRGLKIETVGDIMTVSMTDDPDSPKFEYLAHVRGDERREVFYLGAYKGSKDAENKLRSLSGKMPTVSQTIGTFRAQAQVNGTGYEQSGFYQLVFRQVMYILKYANLDSQHVVGRGCVDKGDAGGSILTGGIEVKGMDWGETTGNSHMKLFGIEDFWGNVWEWVDGVTTDMSRNIYTGTKNFNDGGIGYTNHGQGTNAIILSGHMKRSQGTTKAGFIVRETTGSAATYFCDSSFLSAGCVADCGGCWSGASDAGVFYFNISDVASSATIGVGARLMYL